MLSHAGGLRIAYFFTICFIHFSSRLFSQSYNYRHYTVEDGLISSTVYSTFQDSKGFIWFCTDAGVNRFDGKSFEKFSQDQGLADNEVFKMYEDKRGRIWLLSYNGKLTMLEGDKIYTPSNSSLLKEMISLSGYYNVFEDTRGRLFFMSYFGTITLFDDRLEKKVHFIENDNPGIGEIFESSNNSIVILKEGYRLPESSPDPGYHFSHKGLNVNQYRYIAPGEAFFIAAPGVMHVQDDKEELIIPADRITGQINRSKLFIDRKKNVWITTGTGVKRFDARKNYKTAPLEFLRGVNVSTVYQDNSGNYWFTSLGDGAYFLPEDFELQVNYTVADGISSNDVTAIEADKDGNVWIGFSNGMLNRLTRDGDIDIFNLQFNNAPYCRVRKIECDQENNLWVASDKDVILIQNDEVTELTALPGIEHSWKDLTLEKSTGLPVLASASGVFHVTRRNGKYIFERNKIFPNCRTYSVHCPGSGKLYFNDINGLNYFDGISIKTFPKLAQMDQRINHMCGLDTLLAVASDGLGFFLFKEGKIYAHISSADGLASAICRRIFVDDKTAWIATNHGLTKIVFSAYDRYTVKTFTHSDFLLSEDIRDLLVLNKRVYMATAKGLCIMNDPGKTKHDEEYPLHFTAFQSGGKQFALDTAITLEPSRKSAILHYIALNYKNADQQIYRYRLKGENENWISTVSNHVELLHLSPGVYTFELSAAMGSKWSASQSLSFTVLPAWWQTLWFKIAAAIIFVATAFTLIKIIFERRMQIKFERQGAIERERSRISSDIHDDMGSGLTQIAILSQIAKRDPALSEQTSSILQRIVSITDDMVNKMGEIIWAVNPSNDSLKNLVAYLHEFTQKYFEDSDIEIRVSITKEIPDQPISAAFRRHLFLIVKESYQNIVKHAVAKKVSVGIQVADQQLCLRIIDDGKGFDSRDSLNQPGQGLKNLRLRAHRLGARLEIDSMAGKGTVVIFKGSYSVN
jgi:signal transduction histidine kinase/streptogramin lyase